MNNIIIKKMKKESGGKVTRNIIQAALVIYFFVPLKYEQYHYKKKRERKNEERKWGKSYKKYNTGGPRYSYTFLCEFAYSHWQNKSKMPIFQSKWTFYLLIQYSRSKWWNIPTANNEGNLYRKELQSLISREKRFQKMILLAKKEIKF